jgi:transaldolase
MENALRESKNLPMEERVDTSVGNFGIDIREIMDGRVSLAIGLRSSFETELMVSRARHITATYERNGVERNAF